MTALYYRCIRLGYEESVRQAVKICPDKEKAKYIENEWLNTMYLWAYYIREHSPLLLQILTTNSVESWHSVFV